MGKLSLRSILPAWANRRAGPPGRALTNLQERDERRVATLTALQDLPTFQDITAKQQQQGQAGPTPKSPVSAPLRGSSLLSNPANDPANQKSEMEPDRAILLHITRASRASISVHQRDFRQMKRAAPPPRRSREKPTSPWHQELKVEDEKQGEVYDAIGCFIIRLPDGVSGPENAHKLDEYEFLKLLPPRRRRTSQVEVALEATGPTTYMILPFRLGLDQPPPTSPVVSIHCANPVAACTIKPPNGALRRSFHLLFDANRTNSRMKIQSVAMKSGMLAAEIMTLRHGETIMLLVNNLLEAKYFSVKADYSKSKGVVFCSKSGISGVPSVSKPRKPFPSFRDALERPRFSHRPTTVIQDCVPPMSRQLIMVCVARDPRKGYSWRVSFNYGLRAPPEREAPVTGLYAPFPFFGDQTDL